MPVPGEDTQLQEVQKNIDRTTKEMQANMHLLHQREECLTSLDQKSSTLQGTSQAFSSEATRLKEEQWWKKMRSVCLVSFIIYEVIVLLFFREWFFEATFYGIVLIVTVLSASLIYARLRTVKGLNPLAIPLSRAPSAVVVDVLYRSPGE